MKHILYILTTVILLCGVTVSCSDGEEPLPTPYPPTPTPPTDRTIFVFMPYADGLSNKVKVNDEYHIYLQEDIEEMKDGIRQVGNMNGYRMLVFYATSVSDADLYEIKYNGQTLVEENISHYKNFDISNLSFLTDLFSLVKTTSPTADYRTIVGCHGSAWLPKESRLNWGRAIGNGGGNSSTIDLSTLRQAMQNATYFSRYLLLDNCYMANIESMYEFRDVAKSIISCPSEQPDTGMPYTEIWQQLSASAPDNTDIVSIYHSWYQSYLVDTWRYPNFANLTAVNTSMLQPMADLMKQINAASDATSLDITTIQPMDGGIRPMFYDLKDYVHHLCSDATLLSCFDNYMTQLVECTTPSSYIFTHWINGIYGGYYPEPFSVSTYSGITTSDPSINSVTVSAKKTTAWWNTTH